MSAPDSFAASTTIVPRLRPEIILLRFGKWCFSGGVPSGSSEMSAPLFPKILSASRRFEELNLGSLQEQLVTEKIVGDTKEEQTVLDQLSKEPIHADIITKATGLPASKVSSTLTILEMKGKIKNLGANQYVITR